MPLLIRCTGCNRKFRVQDHLLGKQVKCPKCQTTFTAQVVEDSGTKPVGSDSSPVLPVSEGAVVAKPLSSPNIATDPPAAQLAIPVNPSTISSPTTSEAPPIQTQPQRFEATPYMAFGIIAAVLIVAGLIGLAVGSWIGAAVER